MEHVLHHDPVRLTLPDRPRGPAHEAVDRILLLHVVDRKLMTPPLELIAAVEYAIRPRNEHLPSSGGAHLFRAVRVEDVAAACRVRPQAAPDLHDDRPLIRVRDLDLLAGGGGHSAPRFFLQEASLVERVEKRERGHHDDEGDTEDDEYGGQGRACARTVLDRQRLG
jgi:hypothetical protein